MKLDSGEGPQNSSSARKRMASYKHASLDAASPPSSFPHYTGHSRHSQISQSAAEILKASTMAHVEAVESTPPTQPSKISNKSFGPVLAYAANSHNGIIRPYNEDRISIVLDLKKAGNGQRQKVSFFGIFDGHGGSGCAEFLKDHLHFYVAKQESFPQNPELALLNGFKQAEQDFL